MEVKRTRPIKMFEVIVAHGPYRKGDKIQPTGLYRDALLRQGVIREAQDIENRMVEEPRDRVPLVTRKVGGRK